MNYIEQGQHFGENKSQLIVNDIILNKATALPCLEIPWHYHENAYFLYNLNGNLKEVTKKETFDIIPGSLLFHHGQEPHYNKNITAEVDFFHVELSPAWFKKYDIQPSIIEGNLQLQNPSLKSIFKKLYLETYINDNATKIAVDSLVLQAFSEIIRHKTDKSSQKPTWVSKIEEIINDENWGNLSLNKLANEVGLHPVYLSRKFPEYFKMNFGDYIREKKLEQASLFLQIKSVNNAAIAYECGFSDESHFLRLFKAKFGMTPLQFKKTVKKS
jgi:AraC-like DNA-binding protein